MAEREDRHREGALIVDDEGKAGRGPDSNDEKADDAAAVVEDLLDLLDLDADVDVREDGERIVLDVTGPDAGRAIGKKGQVLDAIQFLTNKIVNRYPETRRHVIVDSGDYRERHEKGLENLAQREAKRAVSEGKVIRLAPMNARDRRVVHLSLAEHDGVETQSAGEGSRRRVQILPLRPRKRRR